MNQTLREHRALRRVINHGRRRPAKTHAGPAIPRAAHPRIAGALVAVANAAADAAQNLLDNGAFVALGLVAAGGILWARAQGWIA